MIKCENRGRTVAKMKASDALSGSENNGICVIGGDARQRFLAQILVEKGYKISAYALMKNKEDIDDYCCVNTKVAEIPCFETLKEALSGCRSVILPFPLSPDGITLNCADEYKPSLKEVFRAISEVCGSGTKVYGGAIKERSREIAASFGIETVDYGAFDEIALENAVPTAEAAVELAMQMLSVTVRGANFAVIGYGRCGSELARLLKAMGGNVCAVARSGRDRARMRNDGVTPLDFHSLTEAVNGADISFNTVPFNVIDCDMLSRLTKGKVIVELASAPGGVDRECAAHYGIKVVHAPSLPGKYAPRTAAEIIARAVIPLL